MVATARDEELAGSELAGPLQAMRDARQLADVHVDALTADETALLAAGVVGRPLREEERALVWSASAGNPFYVIEALREALAEPGPIQAANLRGVLASRLSRVSEPARRLAALASALGRDFGLDLLGAAADLDDDTVVGLVDELWRRGILEHRGARYDFTHDLLREATYDAVTPAQRWLLHRRLAQALEKRGLEPAESPSSTTAAASRTRPSRSTTGPPGRHRGVRPPGGVPAVAALPGPARGDAGDPAAAGARAGRAAADDAAGQRLAGLRLHDPRGVRAAGRRAR